MSLASLAKDLKLADKLTDALKAAQQAKAEDPAAFVADYLADGGGAGDEAKAYVSLSALGVAKQRAGWLVFFLFGLLLCATVMSGFEELLAKEIELAFFVPLLIGHGGNSGGQTVSTIIRALGSGAAKLSDAPRVIFKEACTGLVSACFCVCFLAPALYYGMGISPRVTSVVALTLPCLGTLANTLGSALPFAVTALKRDPAVIVGPLMTTSVDSLGLMLYMLIATTFLTYVWPATDEAPACHMSFSGCVPSNELTVGCKGIGLPLPFMSCQPL